MGIVYEISNNVDDRVYIGSTLNQRKRWNEHKRDLFNNKHVNIHLQNFVNKYGLNSLNFTVLEKVENNFLLIREQYYLDLIINKFNVAETMLGKSHTPEAIAKISKRSLGSNNPMYGKKRPQWLIDKLIESSKGREKTLNEKIIRQINLPNRKELKIINNDVVMYCFSISHAAKIVGVTQQSISHALKNNNKSKGWNIYYSDIEFYKKDVLLKNLHLFDNNCHPQEELINMLKSL